MARRKNQIFNLSFLDLLTSALGAVIFLFVITPKGGTPASQERQAVVYFDTIQMKIFGDLHDSLKRKEVGDTLFTVLVDYKKMPGGNEKSKQGGTSNEAKPKHVRDEINLNKPAKLNESKDPDGGKTEQPSKELEKPPIASKEQPTQNTSSYKGDAPSVPCKVSFEINWQSMEDNIDLFVCKGNSCVYGGRKKDRLIGQWDSGKSRNRLFGNDLRTNQEAVRQFDSIIPGEYKIYAQLKESEQNKKTLAINGLIYTKDKSNIERGESFTKQISSGKDRILLGVVTLQENGNYKFKKH